MNKKKLVISLLILMIIISVFSFGYIENKKLDQSHGEYYIDKDVTVTQYTEPNGVIHVHGEYPITPGYRKFFERIEKMIGYITGK